MKNIHDILRKNGDRMYTPDKGGDIYHALLQFENNQQILRLENKYQFKFFHLKSIDHITTFLMLYSVPEELENDLKELKYNENGNYDCYVVFVDETVSDKIQRLYNEYVAEHGKVPTYVNVNILMENDGTMHFFSDIKLTTQKDEQEGEYNEEDIIFHYSNGVQDLLSHCGDDKGWNITECNYFSDIL